MHTYSILFVYIEISTYKGARPVKILRREKIEGRWINKVVKHVGTARNDAELEILKKIAIVDRSRLVKPGQLSLDLEHSSTNGIFTLGMHHHGAELILGDIFDSLSI